MFGRRTDGPDAQATPMEGPGNGDDAGGGIQAADGASSRGDDDSGVVVPLPKPAGSERALAAQTAAKSDAGSE